MPQLGFKATNKVASIFDMDIFRLEKGQKARIAIIDQEAKMQLTHYVGTGDVQENGRRKGRYYICLGEYEKVMGEGKDVTHCPFCRVAEPVKDAVVSMPRRRFATHIARYRTNNQGVIIKPINLMLEVWQFGDDKFNKLVDRAEEHGDLRRHDLVITCTAQNYQQMDMDVSPTLALRSDPQAVAQYQELQRQRRDLDRLLGTAILFEAAELLVGRSSSDYERDASAVDVDKLNEAFGADSIDALFNLDPVEPTSNGEAKAASSDAPAPKATTAKAATPKADPPKSTSPKATPVKETPVTDGLDLDDLNGDAGVPAVEELDFSSLLGDP